jgi:hypothetical protein
MIAGWVIFQLGCTRAPSPSGNHSSTDITHKALSGDEAAKLAARLANDQCEARYHKRPFSAEQHPAVLQEVSYRWGGLDVAGPGGFSALVTFRQDGSDPHVEVYFSSDALTPPR